MKPNLNLFWIGLLSLLAAGCAAQPAELTEVVVGEAIVSPTPPSDLLQLSPGAIVVLPTEAAIETSPAVPGETTVAIENMTHDSWFVTSPDSSWTVQVQVTYPITEDGITVGDQYSVKLAVFRPDGSQRWQLVDEWRPFGLGYTLPSQFHWSQDGQFLYFTEHGTPDGCPTVFGFDCGLYRVNLEDGSLVNLAGSGCGAARASPSGAWFALLRNNLVEVWASDGSSSSSYPFMEASELDRTSDWQAGGLIWSPDETRLVMTIIHDTCSQGGASSSILAIDLEGEEVSVLVERNENEYLTIDWPEASRILLQDSSGLRFWLDPQTRTISPQR